ncbi:MAG: hypothetical protein LBH70_06695 [Spirochaetaceae bacterium]|jgi:hypothetical protein|nr:hypothetical protein [Spirochaetaceae bacterium]
MAVDRHLNFFEFQKACAKPGCPLCRIVTSRAERYIDNMLFEHVSNRGFRAAFRAAGGFCNFHARTLESFRDGLAVAILDRDILEDELTAFKARKKRKLKGTCPVCEERSRIENEYLSFLLGADGESPEERELREAVTASSGLCIPHYGKLLQTGGRVPSWLREFHESRFEALLRRTNQFIELSAYGRQDEFARLSPEDQVVWKELAALLRGGER